MKLPPSTTTRRDAVVLASLALAAVPYSPLPALADAESVAATFDVLDVPPAEGVASTKALCGKKRAVTGVERTGSVDSPLFKPGQCFDELRTASGGAAEVAFTFPSSWTLSSGPNLDVRDVRTSDSAFVLAAPMPQGDNGLEALQDAFFMNVLFVLSGKYSSVDEREVVQSELVQATLPTGGTQPYRRLSLKFAPLTNNQITVERRALVSATAVGGTVFILVTGSLATRFKAMQPELLAAQESFRVLGVGRARFAASAPDELVRAPFPFGANLPV